MQGTIIRRVIVWPRRVLLMAFTVIIVFALAPRLLIAKQHKHFFNSSTRPRTSDSRKQRHEERSPLAPAELTECLA